jgi:mono/diheme cytochrome c family protein
MKLKELGLAFVGLIVFATPLVSESPAQPAPPNEAEQRALFLRGAQLWPVYCNTCHNARPGGEFWPAEWRMIIMHMRTQANLTPHDAQAVLEYLRSSR